LDGFQKLGCLEGVKMELYRSVKPRFFGQEDVLVGGSQLLPVTENQP
jgi:hypothetical protein